MGKLSQDERLQGSPVTPTAPEPFSCSKKQQAAPSPPQAGPEKLQSPCPALTCTAVWRLRILGRMAAQPCLVPVPGGKASGPSPHVAPDSRGELQL